MSQTTVNTQSNVASGKVTKFRWVVLALIFVIYTIATADRANIGIAMPFIRKEFPMSNTEAGMMMSLFFAGYVLSMIPGGFLVRKLGVSKIFSIFMFFTSLFTGLIGMAGSIFQMKLFRLGVGLSEGPLAVGMPTTINNWFPAKEKGFATGIFIAASKFGPLVVPPLCGLIIQMWGWREIFFFFAIPGVLLGIAWYFIVADKPSQSRFCSPAEAEYIETDAVVIEGKKKEAKPYKLAWLDKIVRAKKIERLDTPKKIFTSWNMIGSSLGYFFMIAITTTMMSWIPTYLVTVKKLAIMKMAFAAAAPFAGTVIGNMVGGWLSDNVFGKRRKPLMLFTALTTSFMMYSLITSPADPWLLGGLLFVTGFFLSLGFSAFVVYPMGLVTKEQFSIATAITNTGGQLGGFCTPIAIGWLLDKYNWDIVFTALAAGCLICFLLVSTIEEPVDDPLV
ncbi:MFS transporter [Sporomusa malonica]|uniref:Sugar phosphate permease n=1 Tax=Sporomusa malonica TaxID=112901 RepID=A0A1W1YB55_9FIRM|nr:MFS transporter [Sporomusa malonica]SMC32958.1 Sugar phosphate permease [Sporomusa malonica]